MTEKDIANAYEWFKKRTEDMREQRKIIISGGVEPSEHWKQVQMNNYVAFKIIEAYASRKGLIEIAEQSNPDGQNHSGS